MRRSQSVRHQAKPALLSGADDLGVLREGDDTQEDVLRSQLLEKDRENDKLRTQIAQLKSQLAERPTLEAVQELRKEYTNLEILLDGTQRENERCMAELERGKQREKALEAHLAKLAGPNWQDTLDMPHPALGNRSGFMSPSHTRAHSVPKLQGAPEDADAQKAFVEQVRLLVLGMEQRLQTREEKLVKSIEHAEAEAARCEALKREVVSTQG